MAIRQKRLVVFLLIAALVVAALTPLTYGKAGMLIYGTSQWLVVLVYGPPKPDALFVHAYTMGLLWPWLAAAVIILLRQLQAGVNQSAPARVALYVGVIYVATLLLAVALSLG